MRLIDAARAALARSPARAAIFNLEGQRYVAKGPGKGKGWPQALLLKVFSRLAFGCHIPLRSLRLANDQARLDYEAGRLERLAAAGEAVPCVLVREPGCMVLEYVGDTLEHALHRLPHKEYSEFLAMAIDDLLRFHAAGHWHGGAQVKNLTLQNDRLYRIDFEEDLGEHLPLQLVQAHDLVLLTNSVTLLCGMNEKVSIELSASLLRRYLAACPSTALRTVLARALPLLSVACKLLVPLRSRRGRSLTRIFVLQAALKRALQD